MKLKIIRWVFTSVCLAGLFSLMAQGPGGPPRHGNMDFVAHEMMSKTVKGAPFAADAVTTTTQTLPNGSHINRTATASLYRDSEGRTRREEQSLAGTGMLAGSSQVRPTVFIHDPVAQAAYVLNPQKKTAQKMAFTPHTRGASGAAGSDGTASTEAATGPHPQHLGGTVKTESLGTQVMDGITVEGTRHTLTIPAGSIGNDQAIESVTERWYSSDLQVVVKSVRTDPRFGQTVYQLSNIRRAEQPATLFEVPSDFAVSAGGRGQRANQ
jgi:hypothetical protein